MRDCFKEKLVKLHSELDILGKLVCDAIEKTITALKLQDLELARTVVSGDDEVDSHEKVVESSALSLLLDETLEEDEVRVISATLKVLTDLERIGDQAADISEILLYYRNRPMQSDLSQVFMMAEKAKEMVSASVEAFKNTDLGSAHRVINSDDFVDSLFAEIRDFTIDRLFRNRNLADEAVDIIMIVKYLERIGDHATNIGRLTVFCKTGVHDRK